MKKVILVYGSIAGVIVGAMFFVTAPFYDNGTLNFDNGMWVGYSSMVISLSLIFFGVKTYRDSYASGVVSFGKAFKIGILITVVASVIYALSWEVAYHTVSKGFVQKMEEHYLQKLKEETKGEAVVLEIEKHGAVLDYVQESCYPFWNVGIGDSSCRAGDFINKCGFVA
ncbi:MAG: DUF4199 domain-containing protein [Cytophagales bacterium]|nr:DUF4199 domain-containing protein [Cytophagales bacterium]